MNNFLGVADRKSIVFVCHGCGFVWISTEFMFCPSCGCGDYSTYPLVEDSPRWWYRKQGVLEVIV